ncbi:MAG: type 1 periplasmic binding fold superfamily protein [Flavobacteriaceae bacterium]|nr:type 1 periplasmic binding fold superfamily protein [Flavobacteriaceae bacterium]
MKKIISTLLSLSLFVILLSCNDNDSPELIQEEEVITSVIVTLQSADNTVTLSSVDLDGDGPNEPVLSVQGLLNANATYTGSVRFLNESVAPLEDITEEVKEEAEEHQVFYSFTAPINSVTTSDNDSNGNPLGLDFTLTTGAAGTAGFGITLRHEPKKPNTGILDAGGETDVAVNFTISVE